MKPVILRAFVAFVLLGTVWAQPGGKAAAVKQFQPDICRSCCLTELQLCPAICLPCMSKQGQCPYVNKAVIICPAGPRRDLCRSDSSCSGGQRCCDTGCRRECTPVCSPRCRPGEKCLRQLVLCKKAPCPQPPPTCEGKKSGTCPVNDILPFISCLANTPDKCSGDSDCAGNDKCCSYGCSRVCVSPCRPACRPDQKCVKKRNSSCLGGCPSTTSCEPKNPCSVVDCKRGHRCVVRGGQAKCIPLTRPGVCPVNDVISTCELRADACSSDHQCRPGQKCCSRGCGRRCVPACSPPCSKCKLLPVPRKCKSSKMSACQSIKRPVCLSVKCHRPCPPGQLCRKDRKGNRKCFPILYGK